MVDHNLSILLVNNLTWYNVAPRVLFCRSLADKFHRIPRNGWHDSKTQIWSEIIIQCDFHRGLWPSETRCGSKPATNCCSSLKFLNEGWNQTQSRVLRGRIQCSWHFQYPPLLFSRSLQYLTDINQAFYFHLSCPSRFSLSIVQCDCKRCHRWWSCPLSSFTCCVLFKIKVFVRKFLDAMNTFLYTDFVVYLQIYIYIAQVLNYTPRVMFIQQNNMRRP